jgi:hypothetical protein
VEDNERASASAGGATSLASAWLGGAICSASKTAEKYPSKFKFEDLAGTLAPSFPCSSSLCM